MRLEFSHLWVIIGLVASACSGGGGGVPPSAYVDTARALLPGLLTGGDSENDRLTELRRRAESGDRDARYNLGELLYGKAQRREGRRWMCLAASDGLGKAMSKLGYWAEYDDRDTVTAVAWYSRGDEQGHRWARKYRENLLKNMTVQEIAAAKDLVPDLEVKSCGLEK